MEVIQDGDIGDPEHTSTLKHTEVTCGIILTELPFPRQTS